MDVRRRCESVRGRRKGFSLRRSEIQVVELYRVSFTVVLILLAKAHKALVGDSSKTFFEISSRYPSSLPHTSFFVTLHCKAGEIGMTPLVGDKSLRGTSNRVRTSCARLPTRPSMDEMSCNDTRPHVPDKTLLDDGK